MSETPTMTLSQEDLDEAVKIREKNKNRIFDTTPFDRELASEKVKAVYADMMLSEPEVIFVNSPTELFDLAQRLLKKHGTDMTISELKINYLKIPDSGYGKKIYSPL